MGRGLKKTPLDPALPLYTVLPLPFHFLVNAICCCILEALYTKQCRLSRDSSILKSNLGLASENKYMYRLAAAACTLTVGSQKVGDIRKKS